MSEEIHFVITGYDETVAVMASNWKEAFEKVEKHKNGKLFDKGTESDIRECLEDQEVIHL